MKKIIIALLILVLLAVTNPSKEAYTSWLKEKVQSGTENPLAKGVVSLFGGPVIDHSTTTDNYVLFTVYTLTFGGKTIKVLGILQNFIPFYSKEDPNTGNKGL